MDKLLDPELFLRLVAPGLVARWAFTLLVASERRKWSDDVLGFLAFGTVHAALFDWLLLLAPPPPSLATVLLRLLFVLVLPILEAVAATALLRRPFIGKWVIHPTDKPWDYFFELREPCWVRLRLKSGWMVGGYYGSRSFASSYPAPEQIYLEETWVLDEQGSFLRPARRSKGVLVSMAECETIEFHND